MKYTKKNVIGLKFKAIHEPIGAIYKMGLSNNGKLTYEIINEVVYHKGDKGPWEIEDCELNLFNTGEWISLNIFKSSWERLKLLFL